MWAKTALPTTAPDIAYLRHIPNIAMLAPRNENLLRHCLHTALCHPGPCALRYPRGSAFGVASDGAPRLLTPGRGEVLQQGEGFAVIALGNRAHPALEAAALVERQTGIKPFVFDPVWIKPCPKSNWLKSPRTFDRILLVEEGVLAGGFSSAVLEFWNDHGLMRGQRIKRLGLPDHFVEHGTQLRLRELGLRTNNIADIASWKCWGKNRANSTQSENDSSKIKKAGILSVAYVYVSTKIPALSYFRIQSVLGSVRNLTLCYTKAYRGLLRVAAYSA